MKHVIENVYYYSVEQEGKKEIIYCLALMLINVAL